jgi:hypothetical protein
LPDGYDDDAIRQRPRLAELRQHGIACQLEYCSIRLTPSAAAGLAPLVRGSTGGRRAVRPSAYNGDTFTDHIRRTGGQIIAAKSPRSPSRSMTCQSAS